MVDCKSNLGILGSNFVCQMSGIVMKCFDFIRCPVHWSGVSDTKRSKWSLMRPYAEWLPWQSEWTLNRKWSKKVMFIDNVYALDFYVFFSCAHSLYLVRENGMLPYVEKVVRVQSGKKWKNEKRGQKREYNMKEESTWASPSPIWCWKWFEYGCVCGAWLVNCNSKRRYFERLFISFAFNLRVHTFKLVSIFGGYSIMRVRCCELTNAGREREKNGRSEVKNFKYYLYTIYYKVCVL